MRPEFLLWGVLAGIGAVVLLKIVYTVVGFRALPPSKPVICFLPKYSIQASFASTDEAVMMEHLRQLELKDYARTEHRVRFQRGSMVLGEFATGQAKVLVHVHLPLQDTTQVDVEYGALFGAFFDTGDLWKFCRELVDKLEVPT